MGEREEGRAERERGISSSGEPLESGAVVPHPTAQMNRTRLIDKDLLFPSLGREPGVPGDVERLHPDRGGGWSGRPLPPLSHSPLGPLRNPLLSILQSPNKPLEDSTLVSNQQPTSQM